MGRFFHGLRTGSIIERWVSLAIMRNAWRRPWKTPGMARAWRSAKSGAKIRWKRLDSGGADRKPELRNIAWLVAAPDFSSTRTPDAPAFPKVNSFARKISKLLMTWAGPVRSMIIVFCRYVFIANKDFSNPSTRQWKTCPAMMRSISFSPLAALESTKKRISCITNTYQLQKKCQIVQF